MSAFVYIYTGLQVLMIWANCLFLYIYFQEQKMYAKTDNANLKKDLSSIELPAKLLNWFSRINKSNINQCALVRGSTAGDPAAVMTSASRDLAEAVAETKGLKVAVAAPPARQHVCFSALASAHARVRALPSAKPA